MLRKTNVNNRANTVITAFEDAYGIYVSVYSVIIYANITMYIYIGVSMYIYANIRANMFIL